VQVHSVLAADRRRPGARWRRSCHTGTRCGRHHQGEERMTGFRPLRPGNGQDMANTSSSSAAVSGRTGVAVVTGGSAGLGRAIVRELAGLGYDIAVLARESQGLHGAAREVDLAGRRGLAVPVDVADAGAVDAAAERVEAE